MHNVKRSHKTTVSSQVAPLALVPMLSTRLGHMHCHIAWNCPIDIITRIATCLGVPYWHYQLVLSWYIHQPESHQFSLQKLSQLVSEREPDP